MHYDNMIIRPPREADSLLLQVTISCSHNKCRFCNFYKEKPFRLEKLENIEADLKEAYSSGIKYKKVFLLNGDAFCLSTEKLKEIIILIKKYFPDIESINPHCRISNIKNKTVQQLKELNEMGIKFLTIGLESARDDVLKRMDKGYTSADAYEQLQKLKDAKMPFSTTILLGLGGTGEGEQSALAAARLLNKMNPNIISVTSIGVFEDTELYGEQQQGEYIPATEMEKIVELKTLLQNLDVQNSIYNGGHPNNVIPMMGVLPADKQKLIDTIDKTVQLYTSKYGPDVLSGVYHRTGV